MNKSTLFRRAWQLKSWNRDMKFGACLKLAWSEFKAGSCRVIEQTRLEVVRALITSLENTDRLGPQGHRRLAAAYDELATLRNPA